VAAIAAPAALSFATPNPANFTADKPSAPEVNAFLKATWGYDPNLAWQVEAIQKTPVAGISKVTVAIGQKSNPSQTGQLVFFSLPDGQHIISQDEIVPFGAHPFDVNRKILETQATGPSRGSASKDLNIVEFADFQCPHCKDAQPTIDRLVQDFPNARFVFESFPLPMHSEAPKAAAYGVCVQKAAGDAAFFKYADAVFDNQAGLTPEQSDATLKDVASKLGLDPAKIAACASQAQPPTPREVSSAASRARCSSHDPTVRSSASKPRPPNCSPASPAPRSPSAEPRAGWDRVVDERLHVRRRRPPGGGL